MIRVGPGTRLFRTAVLPLVIVVAGCQYFRMEAKVPPLPARMPPVVDPTLREIPLENVTVKRPEATPPTPPRVASVQRPPVVRMPTVPPKRPAPPKEAEIPVIAPGELVGSDFTSVLLVLRRPDTVQTSALSVVWTYSPPECTVQLFFYPDIQTKVFRLLKYDLKSDAGEKSADRSACLHDIMAVKNDEPAVP